VLYTDGITEAFNLGEEAYGVDRLIEQVQEHGNGSAEGLVERICRSVATFSGPAMQSDDITLTVLVWRPGDRACEVAKVSQPYCHEPGHPS
jgi:sigma-B regulation protein RsbU (phosphoserine phosphatase)